jgi:putative CocE/NonD family hydrolase
MPPHLSRLRAITLSLLLATALALPGTVSATAFMGPDSGKYDLIMQGTSLGTVTFNTAADGSGKSEMIVGRAGQTITLDATFKTASGDLSEVDFSTPGASFVFKVQGGQAQISSSVAKSTPKTVALPAKWYLISPNQPQTMEQMLADYDASKKTGPQTYNCMVLESATLIQTPVSFLGVSSATVAGKPIALRRYSLMLPSGLGSIETIITTDTAHHVLLFSVPVQSANVIREGYEDLIKPQGAGAALLSQPTYKTKTPTKVMIPMRDGVKLAADLYLPDSPGKFPVILERTPYGRGQIPEALFYAQRGYAVVSEDVRGRGDSGGEWHPFINEPKDGYDTIEWCAKQPWSNGKVGMQGASYLGFVQWAAASQKPPHLVCLIPIVSPPDPFFNIPYAFGAFFLLPDLWWSSAVQGKGMTSFVNFKSGQALAATPLTNVDKAVIGHHIPFVQEWLRHTTNDSYWQEGSFDDKLKDIGPLPALHVSGWYDGDGIGTKMNYAAMVNSGHANQKLIYGPWSHLLNASSQLGGMDFGQQSFKDLDTIYLRWFDHWLKGIDNGIEKEPPVDAFLMGDNQWRSFTAWPPKEAAITKWYFHSAGHANTSLGDGTLTTTLPGSEPTDRYIYDPSKENVPGAVLKMINAHEGRLDGSAAEKKSRDMLVYTSPMLTHDVAVAGPIFLHLVAATSARDTDWIAGLRDVYPDGRSINLCSGIIRARFRNSFSHPTLLKPGQIADYTLDMWAIGNVFKKGHRIRVEIVSSSFPITDRNLNTGENIATGTKMVAAHQKVYHSKAHASYILLPILPS